MAGKSACNVFLLHADTMEDKTMAMKYLDLTMTESVRRAQKQYYGHAGRIAGGPEHDPLGETEVEFIAARDSFYLGTVGETGWPYIQHRGGPKGFLRVLNPTTLAFADYRGNRQLLSTGNLSVNTRVSLFLMDYKNRERLKILGHARIEDARSHPELLSQLSIPSLQANVERIVVIDVVSFDWNCPKYITPRYSAEEVEELVGPLKAKIAELEARLYAARS
ncbi:MAG: pyridoxamine 5'-phosphate oxidase family protein [Nitrospira sp.]|nr:pyridoxamine 5'-phosphate oxidase family protein [Nitrospira sp.]